MARAKRTTYIVEGEHYKKAKRVKTLAKVDKLVSSALRGKNKSVMITKEVRVMKGRKGHKKWTTLKGL